MISSMLQTLVTFKRITELDGNSFGTNAVLVKRFVHEPLCWLRAVSKQETKPDKTSSQDRIGMPRRSTILPTVCLWNRSRS